MLEVLTMVPEEVVEKYDREMDRRTRQNLERFAEFMARMIEKYGHKVLAEMEREEAEKQQNGRKRSFPRIITWLRNFSHSTM